MRLYEFEGAELFRQEGIHVPDYALASSPEEAREKAQLLGLPTIIKAQVLTGGRYLAGGIRTAESLEQVEMFTRRILNLSIGGRSVPKVMVTKKVDIDREFYLSVTVDDYHGTPVIVLSSEGGVAINQLADDSPELVVSKHVPVVASLPVVKARQIVRETGLRDLELRIVADIIRSLYHVFHKYDALIAEINPLAKTTQGDYVALDAKVEIDDSSLFRHPELNLSQEDRTPNPLELKGREIGVTYVDLDGDIGIISSGAGLGMATMDIVSRRFRPANFLETGGAISAELLYNVMDLVLQKEGLRAVFINVYGGINPIHEGAKGIVKYIEEHNVKIPIVAKALGNRQEETWEIFREHGVTVVDGVSTESGVEQLARLLEGNK